MSRFLDIPYEPEESARTKAYVRWKRLNKAAMDAGDRKRFGLIEVLFPAPARPLATPASRASICCRRPRQNRRSLSRPDGIRRSSMVKCCATGSATPAASRRTWRRTRRRSRPRNSGSSGRRSDSCCAHRCPERRVSVYVGRAAGRMPGRLPRSRLASVALRVSSGWRRRSAPSRSSRSKANRNTRWPSGLCRSRSNTASPLSSRATASPSIRQERARSAFTASTMAG